jgi:hypothetical protein
MSTDRSDKDQTPEHEEELKRRNPDERSPEERDGGSADPTETEEGLLGGMPGARGNKPTG